MTYLEYQKQVIETTAESETLQLNISYMWVPAYRMPRGVVALKEGDQSAVIKIPSRVETAPDYKAQIDTIFRSAFENNSFITDMIVGENVRRIGDYAFRNCVNLKRIYLPRRLQKLGRQIFAGCELEDVYYEGTREEFAKFIQMKEKPHQDFGALVSGSPVETLISDTSIYEFDNPELFYTNIHFNVSPLENSISKSPVTVKVDGKDMTSLFQKNENA